MFEELIKKTGLPRDMVEASLEAAIEESLFHCLGMYDCDVDLTDLALMLVNWTACNDPADPACMWPF